MKSSHSRSSFGGQYHTGSGFSFAPVTKWLLIFFIVTFVVDVSSGEVLMPHLALSGEEGIQLWRWICYPLVNLSKGGWLFSMLVFFSFGKLLESSLGSRRFAALLGITTVLGALTYIIMFSADQSPLTGAEGLAISILLATAILNPDQVVKLMIPPIPLKIKYLVGGLIVVIVVIAIAEQVDPAVNLAQLSAIGVSFFCMKNKHWLDVFSKIKRNKKTKAIKKTSRQRTLAKKGMKARTTLNMKTSKREEEINKILDKVSAEGIGNLTEDEREILKFASKK